MVCDSADTLLQWTASVVIPKNMQKYTNSLAPFFASVALWSFQNMPAKAQTLNFSDPRDAAADDENRLLLRNASAPPGLVPNALVSSILPKVSGVDKTKDPEELLTKENVTSRELLMFSVRAGAAQDRILQCKLLLRARDIGWKNGPANDRNFVGICAILLANGEVLDRVDAMETARMLTSVAGEAELNVDLMNALQKGVELAREANDKNAEESCLLAIEKVLKRARADCEQALNHSPRSGKRPWGAVGVLVAAGYGQLRDGQNQRAIEGCDLAAKVCEGAEWTMRDPAMLSHEEIPRFVIACATSSV